MSSRQVARILWSNASIDELIATAKPAKRAAKFQTLPTWRCEMYRDQPRQGPSAGATYLRTLETPQRCRECGATIPAGSEALEAFDNIGGESMRYRTSLYLHTERCA
jgi:hypothetical protein